MQRLGRKLAAAAGANLNITATVELPRAIDGASDLVFESDGLAWTLRFPVKRDHLEPPAA